jgi:hypothetical protein
MRTPMISSKMRDHAMIAASRHADGIQPNISTAYSNPSVTCTRAAAIVIGAIRRNPCR